MKPSFQFGAWSALLRFHCDRDGNGVIVQLVSSDVGFYRRRPCSITILHKDGRAACHAGSWSSTTWRSIAIILRKILHSDGFEVETVADGLSAWNELRAQKYHLLITDLRMPELSGLELLGKVRAEKMPVGVIVLTAFGDPSEALQAMKAGADDFVAKPIEPDHLRFLIKRILERRELIDELERLQQSIFAATITFTAWSPRVRRFASCST